MKLTQEQLKALGQAIWNNAGVIIYEDALAECLATIPDPAPTPAGRFVVTEELIEGVRSKMEVSNAQDPLGHALQDFVDTHFNGERSPADGAHFLETSIIKQECLSLRQQLEAANQKVRELEENGDRLFQDHKVVLDALNASDVGGAVSRIWEFKAFPAQLRPIAEMPEKVREVFLGRRKRWSQIPSSAK